MSNIPSFYPARNGEEFREDGTIVNSADYLVPEPNGAGQSLTISAAGLVTLSPPANTIMVILTNPLSAVRVAFGGAVASATVGILYPAGSCPCIQSAALIASMSVYWLAADTGAYATYLQ